MARTFAFGLLTAGLLGAPRSAGAQAAADSSSSPARTSPAAADHGPWFYRGLPYGSESQVNPLQLIVNGGFGILQFDDQDARLGDVKFRAGWHRVTSDMLHPVRAIEVAGWNDFLLREVIPVSLSKRGAQYWPNYTLHLIGGGMSYTMMSEWFEQRGYAGPKWWAGGTLAVYHGLNEVVENSEAAGPNTDAIADLYIFDPAAVLLFSHEGVNRFFSRRLHLRDWSNQPAIGLQRGTIENQGQNFSIKLPVPRTEHWSVLYYFGNHGQGGLTYTREDGSAFSAAVGMRARKLVDVGHNEHTVDLVPSYGLFYDRNGSLLFSLVGARTTRYKLRLNAYPGLLGFRGVTVGLFALWNQDGKAIFGIDLPWLPVGAAVRP